MSNDFRSCLQDIRLLAAALKSIQMTVKERDDLGQLFESKGGIPVVRDKGNRVRGETLYSCSKVGGYLTRHFGGVGPQDKMTWIGYVKRRGENERWLMQPEIRAAISSLGWFLA